MSIVGCFACVVPELSREELMDPQQCAECHPDHYDEWSGSMHAYAAEDPVFLAMNERGQRETGGELGDFCINCHAPMAVREGFTTDGLNIAEAPSHLRGITCYFCHNTVDVTGDHNNPLVLADDRSMRGGIDGALANTGHKSKYSELHDRDRIESSELCGACHDIVTPVGLHLERSFKEWRESIYAHDKPGLRQTCNSCHMQGRDAPAADYEGVVVRRVHKHSFAGVDTALTDFPNMEAQREEVQTSLDTTIATELQVCPIPAGTEITLTLENISAGHSWPSGAAQDRRAWVELIAYDGQDNVLWSTGVVDEATALLSVEDPQLWRFGDTLFDDGGNKVHMFWDATELESYLLPAPTAFDPLAPEYIDTHLSRSWQLPGIFAERVTARLRIRPVGLDVLDDLIDSGDLDPAIRGRMNTIDLAGSTRKWTTNVGPCE